MQFKIFTIPIHDSTIFEEEMNAFLRGKRVIEVEKNLVHDKNGSFWTFCVRYLIGEANNTKISTRQEKKDYKSILKPVVFDKFMLLRKTRKEIAQEEALPAFAIFTDEELILMAGLEEINAKTIQSINGIGEKKIEKYGKKILESLTPQLV